MNVRLSLLVLVLSAPTVSALNACSGESAAPPGPKDLPDRVAPLAPGADADSPDSGSDGVPSATSPDASPTAEAGPEIACSAKPTLTSCQTCCYAAHAAGSTYLVEQMAACECGGSGPCNSACATTLCAKPVKAASAACSACVQGNITGACASVLTSCEAVPDCAAVLTCLQSCTGKP